MALPCAFLLKRFQGSPTPEHVARQRDLAFSGTVYEIALVVMSAYMAYLTAEVRLAPISATPLTGVILLLRPSIDQRPLFCQILMVHPGRTGDFTAMTCLTIPQRLDDCWMHAAFHKFKVLQLSGIMALSSTDTWHVHCSYLKCLEQGSGSGTAR